MRNIYKRIIKKRDVKVVDIRSTPIYQLFVSLEEKKNLTPEEVETLKDVIRSFAALLNFEDELNRKKVGQTSIEYMKPNFINRFWNWLATALETHIYFFKSPRKFREVEDWQFENHIAEKVVKKLRDEEMLKEEHS